MSRELRNVFESFLKEFKETYNRKILQIIDDLHSAVSKLYKKKDLFWQGYEKALKDMETAFKRVR